MNALLLAPLNRQRRQCIRKAFNRSATTYDAAATLQREVAEQLLALFAPRLLAHAPRHLLDAGCGTGHGARQWREHLADVHITGVDLAFDMLARARPVLDAACVADMTALPFSSEQFDAWWSNLALQWCDPVLALREAARVLKPGAWLAFSTLGPKTFWELRQAMSGLASPSPGPEPLAFQSASLLSQALAGAGLTVHTQARRSVIVLHDELRTLLRDLRAVGANVGGHDTASAAPRPLGGRRAWTALQTAYEIHRQADGLPLTYDVHWVIARKEAS